MLKRYGHCDATVACFAWLRTVQQSPQAFPSEAVNFMLCMSGHPASSGMYGPPQQQYTWLQHLVHNAHLTILLPPSLNVARIAPWF